MSMTGMKIKSEIVFRHLPGQIGICTFPSLDVFPGLTHFVTQRGENHPGDPFSSFNLGRHSGEDLSIRTLQILVSVRSLQLCF